MFEWVDHTAEVELRIEAGSEDEVYGEAARALTELLGEPAHEATIETVPVELEAPDRAALLAAWVEELVFLAETRGLLPRRLAAIEAGAERLRATLEARAGTPRHLVKAVTYHGLRFERTGGRWVAALVLDV